MFIEITTLGLRNLQAMLRISKPYLEFELPNGKRYRTDPSKVPSPRNPNFLQVLRIPVDLPTDPLFAPVIDLEARDHQLGGLVKRLLGTAALGLSQFMVKEDGKEGFAEGRVQVVTDAELDAEAAAEAEAKRRAALEDLLRREREAAAAAAAEAAARANADRAELEANRQRKEAARLAKLAEEAAATGEAAGDRQGPADPQQRAPQPATAPAAPRDESKVEALGRPLGPEAREMSQPLLSEHSDEEDNKAAAAAAAPGTASRDVPLAPFPAAKPEAKRPEATLSASRGPAGAAGGGPQISAMVGGVPRTGAAAAADEKSPLLGGDVAITVNDFGHEELVRRVAAHARSRPRSLSSLPPA
jgi:hypothetical protein